jgi:hypothetical protein
MAKTHATMRLNLDIQDKTTVECEDIDLNHLDFFVETPIQKDELEYDQIYNVQLPDLFCEINSKQIKI